MNAYQITGYIFLSLTSACMLTILILFAKFFLHDRKEFKSKKCEDMILRGCVKIFALVPKLITYAVFLIIFLTDIKGEEDNPFVALIAFFVVDMIVALFAFYTLNFRVKFNKDTIEYRDLFCIKHIISYDDIYIVYPENLIIDVVYYKRWFLFTKWCGYCENDELLEYYQGQYFARQEGIDVQDHKRNGTRSKSGDTPVKKRNQKYAKLAGKYSYEHPNWDDVVFMLERKGLDVNLCTWYAFSRYEKHFYDGYVADWLYNLFMKADDADDQDTTELIADIDLDPPKGLDRIAKIYDQSTIEYEKRKVRFALLGYAVFSFTKDDTRDYVSVCNVLGKFYGENLPKEISDVPKADFSAYKTALTDWLSTEKHALQNVKL